MDDAPEPLLLQIFLEFGEVDNLDKPSKAALRLCNKRIKAAVDATVTTCTVKPDAVDALMRCDWPLKELEIKGEMQNPSASKTFKIFPGPAVSKFPLLESLTIDKCRDLTSLPENIGQWSRLEKLKLHAIERLKALPLSFSQLTRLRGLEISRCFNLTVEGIAPLKHLKQLKRLELLDGPTDDPLFPQWIIEISSTMLESLTLGVELTDFIPNIERFKNLKRLVFSGYDSIPYPIEIELPGSIRNLSSLKDLHLDTYEQPIILPESFSELTALEDLWLSTNMRGIGPLQHLTGLTKLELTSVAEFEDDFIQYPDFIWNLTLLKDLSLADSRILTLPNALTNLKNLETLALHSFKNIEELPDSIGNLTMLTSLEINFCSDLKSLPESLGNLTSLKRLDLSGCRDLVELPESIGNLNALQRIMLNNCKQLTAIPESFVDRILARPHEKWPSVSFTLANCGNMVFYDRALLALELLRSHKVLVE